MERFNGTSFSSGFVVGGVGKEGDSNPFTSRLTAAELAASERLSRCRWRRRHRRRLRRLHRAEAACKAVLAALLLFTVVHIVDARQPRLPRQPVSQLSSQPALQSEGAVSPIGAAPFSATKGSPKPLETVPHYRVKKGQKLMKTHVCFFLTQRGILLPSHTDVCLSGQVDMQRASRGQTVQVWARKGDTDVQ